MVIKKCDKCGEIIDSDSFSYVIDMGFQKYILCVICASKAHTYVHKWIYNRKKENEENEKIKINLKSISKEELNTTIQDLLQQKRKNSLKCLILGLVVIGLIVLLFILMLSYPS